MLIRRLLAIASAGSLSSFRRLTNHSQEKMTEEYLRGDKKVYQEGFADLDLALIPKLKVIN